MQHLTYFLGANTPEGFHSHYDTLFSDPRIERLYILKGGPGCGKSTLMRTVAAAAEARGCGAEQVLCSSDPDSLDALIVPQAGLAVVDGTAPHVVEPPLCGLDAWYLDLGKYYRGDVLAQNSAALREAKEKNAACYPLCSLALKAAQNAAEGMRTLAAAALPAGLFDEFLERLLPPLLPKRSRKPVQLCRYLCAFTPQGVQCQSSGCGTRVVIRDDCGLCRSLLERIAARYIAQGHDVILCGDPLFPGALLAVVVPDFDTVYCASSQLFPLCKDAAPQLDLDALVAQQLNYEKAQRFEGLAQLRGAAVHEALRHLSNAKRHHDALEAIYRPAVDFAGVNRAAEQLVQALDVRLRGTSE